MTNNLITPTDIQILNSLKSVIDPELMVNIADLGMIYDIKVDNATKTIKIDMTFTSKGCPLGDVIIQHATEVLKAQYPDFSSSIAVVWEPAWNSSFITEEGRRELE